MYNVEVQQWLVCSAVPRSLIPLQCSAGPGTLLHGVAKIELRAQGNAHLMADSNGIHTVG